MKRSFILRFSMGFVTKTCALAGFTSSFKNCFAKPLLAIKTFLLKCLQKNSLEGN